MTGPPISISLPPPWQDSSVSENAHNYKYLEITKFSITRRCSVVCEPARQMTYPYLSPSCVQYAKILSYSSLAGHCNRVSKTEIDRHRHIADELKAEKM